MNTILPFLTVIQPVLSVLAEFLVPAVVAYVAYFARQTFKLNDATKIAQFEKQMAEALHQAAANGLKLALGNQAGRPPHEIAQFLRLDNSPVVQALEYVLKNNPGSVKHFGLNADTLIPIVLSKLPEVLALIAKRE